MKTDEIGNRHLLAVDELQSTMRSEHQHVRIVVSEQWALSFAGQLLASCLVNLLCRQIKLVGHIEVVAQETPALIYMPNGDSVRSFPECLQRIAAWAVNDAIPVATVQSAASVDYTVFIGEAPIAPDSVDGHILLAVGEGWKAWVGEPFHATPLVAPMSSNPLGPFLAAALVAGEIFKRGRGIRRGRFLSADGYSLWSGVSSSNWIDLDEGPQIANAILPPVHVIGAGAVGNALSYIVANLGLGEGYLVLIDDDRYDETNLNRCLLAGWQDLGNHKVDAITRALSAGRVGVYPFSQTIKSYVTDARAGLRADVERQVDDLVFAIVASCVDKGTSRQDIQGLRPDLLLGGSTLSLQAKSNLYSSRPGAACLACFNPSERDGEKIRALENQLRRMPADERDQFLRAHGLDAKAIEGYLSGVQCGGLGEAALRDFVARPPAEFSAGFVSLGAALLLAAALLRSAVFSANATIRRDMSTLNFLNGGFMDAWVAADEACEQKCQARLAAAAASGV
jgi:ThiF family